jgi:hypothetical protein
MRRRAAVVSRCLWIHSRRIVRAVLFELEGCLSIAIVAGEVVAVEPNDDVKLMYYYYYYYYYYSMFLCFSKY